MSDGDALLAAIRAYPLDDTPKLVYADWLDDYDQPEAALYLREMVALAREENRTSFEYLVRQGRQLTLEDRLEPAWVAAVQGRVFVPEPKPEPPPRPAAHHTGSDSLRSFVTVTIEICDYLSRRLGGA